MHFILKNNNLKKKLTMISKTMYQTWKTKNIPEDIQRINRQYNEIKSIV